jgi:hypothetical protein
MAKHFFAHIKMCSSKKVYIKGLSFDKLSWFLLPESTNQIDDHPKIKTYISKLQTLKPNGTRTSKILITNTIKSIYLNDEMQFVFNGKLLELENNQLEESIVKELSACPEYGMYLFKL